ncbi:HAMP domain-containing protein [Halopseudomonas pachastrellae]|nr:HAMP domain-containing protein [Halopseudomonas pachastrellae]
MLLVLLVSQMLISFITQHILALRDVMISVQNSGDLTLRAKADSRDEVGSMARAFNAMQQSSNRSSPRCARPLRNWTNAQWQWQG